MLTAADASAQILAHVHEMPTESMPLAQALGYVSAEDIGAQVTHPPWRNASMDGYAVRSADVTRVPTRLRVVGEIAAGQFPSRMIAPGEAMRIMTGAPLPDEADTVIRVEDTEADTGEGETRMDHVIITDARDVRKNVRPSGEDFQVGETLLHAGDELTPAAIGVLASTGICDVDVYRRPTVAVVSSGDELVLLDGFDAVRAAQRIISSNSYTLPALIRIAGGIPYDFGVAADTPQSLRAKIEAARGCDLIVTSAGISVGDHDYTRDVVQALGAEITFWKVRIRPGAPLAFGTIDGTPWIGLSGNPVSAMVTFELFVRPAIRKMCGQRALFPHTITVTLEEPITIAAPLTHFLRAIVTQTEAGYTARLTGTQSSAALTSMLKANALLILSSDRQHYDLGETVSAIPLGNTLSHSHRFPVWY